MIQFSCPACSRQYSVPDDKAGRRARCAKCNEMLVVPHPAPAQPNAQRYEGRTERWPAMGDPPRSPARLLWWTAGAVSFILIGAVAGLAVLTNSTRDGGAESGERMESRPPAPNPGSDPTEQKQAEQARLRNEVERTQTELTRLKDEITRKEASRTSQEALTKVRALIAEMDRIDTGARAIIVKYDQDGMLSFADAGIDPNDSRIEEVKLFYDQRRKLTERVKDQLMKLLDSARQATDALKDAPADIKASFDTAAAAELVRGEAILKRPHPNPLASYKDALAAVQTIKDAIRQQRVQKSKQAQAALEAYDKSLPGGYGNGVCQGDMIPAILLLRLVNDLHAEKKLTKETATKVWRDDIKVLRSRSFQFVISLRELLKVGGDFRFRHDPERPSFRESFELFRDLLDFDAIEKELLKNR